MALPAILACAASVAGVISLQNGSAAAAASPTYGLPRLQQVENLPVLQPQVAAGGESSHQRNTSGTSSGNTDWNNFLFTYNNEKVMLDQQGPGSVYRIWVTGYNASTDWIKVYFDGETTPRVNKMMRDVFSGSQAPFLAPLTADNSKSSGGYTSYLPLPYGKSVRITTNMSGWYNISYHSYSPDTVVTTWTGNEDSSAVRNQWSSLGTDPKSDSGNVAVTGTVDLPAGSPTTLLDTSGPRQISAIKLKFAGVVPMVNVADNGRAHKGSSQFSATIDPSNTGVVLKRRFDFGVGNQKADVFVDGTLAGSWSDSGSDATYHWRDSSFNIPANLTANKSRITVKIQFVSSDNDWNEFYYWVSSIVGGAPKQTDTLDVGDSASESAHSYTIVTQTWSGTQQFLYPPAAGSPDSKDLLNNTRIRISWDGETTPSIDTPVGAFFAVGNHGAFASRNLMAGMNPDGQMYVYLPMPFQQRALVQLVNNRSMLTSGVQYEIRHKPFSGAFGQLGYLRTQYRSLAPAQSGQDITLLDTTGSGNLVGVTASYADPGGPGYLEGDERIYVDDSQSPAIYGTGTEDFFDGGFYFDHGPFSRPASSMTVDGWTGPNHVTAASKFYLADSIPFRRHIVAGIQHGGFDETTGTSAWTLAYYYQKPAATLNLTDTLDVGAPNSENAHAYSINTPTFTGSRTYQYEGTADATNITDNGRAHKGYSTFDMAVDSNNNGVILRRRFDQGITNQRADVFVKNDQGVYVKAGQWYVGGGNGYHRWRDSDFFLPPSVTAGKSRLHIKIQFVSSTTDWNEFRYQTYTIAP